MKIINQLVVQSDMPNDNNVIWVCGNTAKFIIMVLRLLQENLMNLGGVKAITNIADLNTDTATIGQVAGVINNLLAQFRTSGLIQV